MAIGRFLGWLLLLTASVVLVRDAIAWTDTHSFVPLSLGGLWSNLSAGGPIALRITIERVAPWLWAMGIRPVLSIWALPVFAILGLAVLWFCRRPPQRRFR